MRATGVALSAAEPPAAHEFSTIEFSTIEFSTIDSHLEFSTIETQRIGIIEPSTAAVKTSAPDSGFDAGARVTAPAAIVVDTGGLEALVTEVAAEDSYAFDTEFHTERTYVPDLALIQIAWADKVALVDPLAVDPAPLAGVFEGPGIAVAHAASQDLDVLMAACGSIPTTVFDTQIVAGFLGLSTPSLSRLVDQMLGVSLPKADRLSDWLVRPISDRQVSYALNDVAHLLELRDVLTERLRALGRLEWALSECDQVLGDRTPARVPEEAWWKLGDIRGMARRSRAVAQEVAAWRERTAATTNRPRRMVLSDLGLMALSQRPPRSAHELRAARGIDGRHLAQGRAAEILQAVERGLALPPDQIRMPSERRDAPAPPPRLPCAQASCARSPTTSISTRASSPRGPTSRSSSAASPAGSIRGGAGRSWGTRCAG